MQSRFSCCLIGIICFASPFVSGQKQQPPSAPSNGGDFSTVTDPMTRVPTDVILVKGAWSSASDTVTPVPEGGSVTNSVFNNEYFKIHYSLPQGWVQKWEGPPPSDSGRYVLAQIRPADTHPGQKRGSVLITAQDMFFAPQPAANALELMNYAKENLQTDYKVEQPPTRTEIAGRPFVFLAYWSPVAELHWYVMATQIRCHTVEFVMTSRDTKLLESLVLDMNKMTLPAEASPASGTGGGDAPVCIKDYAQGKNVLARVDPLFSEAKFNPVPVRIIIDKKGTVKHIHFLSAFPGQAKAITDALGQWKFKAYLREGQPVEVETGIMFGREPRVPGVRAASAAVE
jgi:hypothetical protein